MLIIGLIIFFVRRKQRREREMREDEFTASSAIPTPFRITKGKGDRVSLSSRRPSLEGTDSYPGYGPSPSPSGAQFNLESSPFIPGQMGRNEKRGAYPFPSPPSPHGPGHGSGPFGDAQSNSEFNPYYDVRSSTNSTPPSGPPSIYPPSTTGTGTGTGAGRDTKLARERERDRDARLRPSSSTSSTSLNPLIPQSPYAFSSSGESGSSGMNYPPQQLLPPGAAPARAHTSSTNSSNSQGVIVHRDAGPVENEENPAEIPPAYEDIRRGKTRRR
jgi:hypothetical protein